MEGDYGDYIQTCLPKTELLSVLLAGVTCVGAWVLLTWLIQVVFSIVWPFFMVLIVLILMPEWRSYLTEHIVPNYIENVREVVLRVFDSYNGTYTGS